MIDKKGLILYGIAGLVAIIAVALGYLYFKRARKDAKEANHVMNKIKDFYSMQDNQNKPDINY